MSAATDGYPSRIVCLTEEPTEVLYLLGEQHRIVGISGFTVRPPIARREKPKVSAFTSAKIAPILALEPDLVIGFSDIQAEIARDLVREGVEVWISNHRSVAGILGYVRRLGAMVGAAVAADRLAGELEARIEGVRGAANRCPGGRGSTSRNGTSRRSRPSPGSANWSGSPAATTSFPSARRAAWRRAGSSMTARQSSLATRSSSSARGAGRSSGPSRSPLAPAGRRSTPCAADGWPRSSRR